MSLIKRSEHAVGENKLVRLSSCGHQLYVTAPNNNYNPKVGVQLHLPAGEAVNIDTSPMEWDGESVSGPELDFGLDLFALRALYYLIGEFLEKEPWKAAS